MRKVRFILTEDHVKLARAMYVSWDSVEYGAPCIDPKRPYGNSDVAEDIHELLGWPLPTDEEAREQYLESDGHQRAQSLHRSMERALQVILRAGSFEPGVYEADEYRENWERVR